jgi:hypothetical protein
VRGRHLGPRAHLARGNPRTVVTACGRETVANPTRIVKPVLLRRSSLQMGELLLGSAASIIAPHDGMAARSFKMSGRPYCVQRCDIHIPSNWMESM